MDDRQCPGKCNNQARRAQAVYQAARAAHDKAMASLPEGTDPLPGPEPPELKPWPGEPVWCRRCASAIRAAVADLDDLAALRMSQTPGSTGAPDDTGRVATTRGVPSPSPAMDDVDELAGWLRDWEAVARGGDARPRRGYLATELTTVTAWLVQHLDTLLLNLEVAEDFGTEALRWHRELTEKTRTGTGLKHMKQPCPRCGLYTLWREDGAQYVKCRDEDCGRMLSLAEYEAMAEEQATVAPRFWRAGVQDRRPK